MQNNKVIKKGISTESSLSTYPDQTLTVGISSSGFLSASIDFGKSVASLAAKCLNVTNWHLPVAPLRTRYITRSSLLWGARKFPLFKIYQPTKKRKPSLYTKTQLRLSQHLPEDRGLVSFKPDNELHDSNLSASLYRVYIRKQGWVIFRPRSEVLWRAWDRIWLTGISGLPHCRLVYCGEPDRFNSGYWSKFTQPHRNGFSIRPEVFFSANLYLKTQPDCVIH